MPQASGVSRRAWSGLARRAYVFYTAPPYGANGLWWAERGLCRHAQQRSTPFALGLTGRELKDSVELVDRAAASRSFGRKLGRPLFTHIAYLDESGTHREARHLVVAGLVAFERNIYFLSGGLDAIQAKYFPDYQGRVFFHASSLHAAEKRIPEPFKGLSQTERDQIASEVYNVISESHACIIAVAIEKSAIDGDPYELGFEEIVSRFDRLLAGLTKNQAGYTGWCILRATGTTAIARRVPNAA